MKKWFIGLLAFLFPFIILLSLITSLLGIVSNNSNETPSGGKTSIRGKNGLSAEVLQYEDLVKKLTEEAGIPEVANVILAIIQVESGGRGGDVMQSSESQGLPPETIQDPETSIRAGIQAFKIAYEKTKKYNMDILVAAAGYNYGNAFIDWLHNKGLDYSLENSERYSKEVVAPSLGNTAGETYSYVNEISKKFGKQYLYLNGGNFYYPELVGQYLKFGEDSSEKVQIAGSGEFQTPFASYTITSPFEDHRSIILQDGMYLDNTHNGVDFVPSSGNPNEPVGAIADGVVVDTGLKNGTGNMVLIQHESNLYSHYYHLSSISVEIGQEVKKGDIIGNMGSTGWSTGPHLHLGTSTQPWAGLFDPMTILK